MITKVMNVPKISVKVSFVRTDLAKLVNVAVMMDI